MLFILTLYSNEDVLIPQSFYLYEFTFILGETDWKIIAIDMNDPLADELKGKYSIFQLTS
jgi:hypothetical protein